MGIEAFGYRELINLKAELCRRKLYGLVTGHWSRILESAEYDASKDVITVKYKNIVNFELKCGPAWQAIEVCQEHGFTDKLHFE